MCRVTNCGPNPKGIGYRPNKLLMGLLTVNLGLKLVRGEKTHNQGLNISPRNKFLDELAISESLFFTVLQ